jgi:predicted acyltransferase
MCPLLLVTVTIVLLLAGNEFSARFPLPLALWQPPQAARQKVFSAWVYGYLIHEYSLHWDMC